MTLAAVGCTLLVHCLWFEPDPTTNQVVSALPAVQPVAAGAGASDLFARATQDALSSPRIPLTVLALRTAMVVALQFSEITGLVFVWITVVATLAMYAFYPPGPLARSMRRPHSARLCRLDREAPPVQRLRRRVARLHGHRGAHSLRVTYSVRRRRHGGTDPLLPDQSRFARCRCRPSRSGADGAARQWWVSGPRGCALVAGTWST